MSTFTSPRMLPHRMPIDANTIYRWTFSETSAPFLNSGNGGILSLSAVSGENSSWKGGQPDGLFGTGLKFNTHPSSVSSGAIRSGGSSWAPSSLTVSCWVTPTRYFGSSNTGRIFFKAFSASWVSPFVGFDIEFNTLNQNSLVAYVTVDSTPVQISTSAVGQYQGITLNQPHLVGLTYGDGALKLYIDGYLVSSTSDSRSLNLGTGAFCIGDDLTPATTIPGMILHEARCDNVVRAASWWLENWRRGKGEWAA